MKCLFFVKGVKIYVMSDKKNNPMHYSRYINGISYYSKTNSNLDWIKNINGAIVKYSIDVVMPIHVIGIKKRIEYGSEISYKYKFGLFVS